MNPDEFFNKIINRDTNFQTDEELPSFTLPLDADKEMSNVNVLNDSEIA